MADDYLERLAATIIQLRALRGMSQAQLAEKVDRSEAAVSRWETGKAMPKAIDLVKLAEALSAPAALLLDPPPIQASPVEARLREEAAARAVAEGPDERDPVVKPGSPPRRPSGGHRVRRGR